MYGRLLHSICYGCALRSLLPLLTDASRCCAPPAAGLLGNGGAEFGNFGGGAGLGNTGGCRLGALLSLAGLTGLTGILT